jgi:hypothetical protein
VGAVELNVVNADPALAGPTTPTSSGIDLKTENGKLKTKNRFLRESVPVWQSALLETK